jgi:FHS family L-fucose permease-like MFS transporter
MATQETEIIDADVGLLENQYSLFLGVWSQFWYVGGQVAIAGYFINYRK